MVIHGENVAVDMFLGYCGIKKEAGLFFKEGIRKIAWFGESCIVANLAKLQEEEGLQ